MFKIKIKFNKINAIKPLLKNKLRKPDSEEYLPVEKFLSKL